MESSSLPEYFKLKKYLLLGVMLIAIANDVYLFFNAETTTGQILDSGLEKQFNTMKNRKTATLVMQVALGLDIVYYLAMAYGVVKHQICLVTTLTVIEMIGTIAALLGCLFGLVDVLTTVVVVVMAIVAFLFLRDIRLMADQERNAQLQGGGKVAIFTA